MNSYHFRSAFFSLLVSFGWLKSVQLQCGIAHLARTPTGSFVKMTDASYFRHPLAGNGPQLVRRNGCEIVELSSNQSGDMSLAESARALLTEHDFEKDPVRSIVWQTLFCPSVCEYPLCAS
jgi:hypothetical protein